MEHGKTLFKNITSWLKLKTKFGFLGNAYHTPLGKNSLNLPFYLLIPWFLGWGKYTNLSRSEILPKLTNWVKSTNRSSTFVKVDKKTIWLFRNAVCELTEKN